jgi:hypothetical protein
MRREIVRRDAPPPELPLSRRADHEQLCSAMHPHVYLAEIAACCYVVLPAGGS